MVLVHIASRGARRHVPRALLRFARAEPFEAVEVPTRRRRFARFHTPRAAMFARPLEQLEVPAACRRRARALAPRAAVLTPVCDGLLRFAKSVVSPG